MTDIDSEKWYVVRIRDYGFLLDAFDTREGADSASWPREAGELILPGSQVIVLQYILDFGRNRLPQTLMWDGKRTLRALVREVLGG